MSTEEDLPVLKYDNLRASSRGLTEFESNRVILSIPASDIDRIVLKFGYSSHRPLLTMIFGALTIPIGIYGLAEILTNPAGMRYEIGMISIGVIGGSVLFDTLKKRYFLEIHHGKNTSRLVLTRKATRDGILDFCDKVSMAYKYDITKEVM